MFTILNTVYGKRIYYFYYQSRETHNSKTPLAQCLSRYQSLIGSQAVIRLFEGNFRTGDPPSELLACSSSKVLLNQLVSIRVKNSHTITKGFKGKAVCVHTLVCIYIQSRICQTFQ